MKTITKEQFKVMPWKNGGGITTELFRLPENGSDFDVRLSVADVSQNGPFSHFPEIDRWLCTTHGDGIHLKFSDKEVILKNGDRPFFFKGEDEIFCRLINSQVRDFNVMLKRDHYEAVIEYTRNALIKSFFDLTLIYQPDLFQLTVLKSGEEYMTSGDAIVVKIKRGPKAPAI